MKHLALVLLGIALGALQPLQLFGNAHAAPQVDDRPPHLKPGQVIYGFDVLRGKINFFDALAPATPMSILDVKGGWALVNYPSQTRGPEWINFDNVITYRTEQ